MDYKLQSIICVFLAIVCSISVSAQKEGNIWYFGANAGLDFNSGAPVSLTDGMINTLEGCATISDPDGNLLFYTDGMTIWNKNHEQMVNGGGLPVDSSSTQAAIIVPQPGNDSLYYVFIVDEKAGPDGLGYSVVNINREQGLGEVVIKNVLLHVPVTEKVTGVRHSNGVDVWVITHEWNSDAFLAYLLTPTGLNTTPVVSNVGTIHNSDANGTANTAGYLKASPSGDKLALAILAKRLFEVLDFDNTTGVVTNPITLTGFDNPTVGVEFSPNGTLLYGTKISIFGQGEIFQFNLQAGSPDAIKSSVSRIGVSSNGLPGALQLAPDGKIYVAKLDDTFLGVIENPNTVGFGSNYIDDAFQLAGGGSQTGLPNFMQSYFEIQRSITVERLCLGESTLFGIANGDDVDSIHWDFDDPASGAANMSQEISPTHLFSSPGTYDVEIIFHFNGKTDTVIQQIAIVETPVAEAGPDAAVVICVGEEVQLGSAPEPGLSYQWSPEQGLDGALQAEPLASPAITTEYILTVTNGECENTDTVIVIVNPLPVVDPSQDIIADTVVCEGGSVELWARGGVLYEWSPAEGLSDPAIQNPIATPEDNTEYTVRVVDENGCSITMSVAVAVDAGIIAQASLPDISVVPGDSVAVPIQLEVNPGILPIEAATFLIRVRYSRVMLEITAALDGNIISRIPDDDEEVLEVEVTRQEITTAVSILTVLRGVALLTTQDSSLVTIEEIRVVEGACFQDITGADGASDIHGFCLAFSLDIFVPLAIAIESNPASTEIGVRIFSSIEGEHFIGLYDSYGRKLWGSVWNKSQQNSDEKEIHIDTDTIAAGVYFLKVIKGNQVRTEKVLVIK